MRKQEQQKVNVKQFIAVVRKYTDMQQLTASVLREFIDHIEVSQTDKQTKTREIKIVYSFIGAFDFEQAMTKTKTAKTKKNGIAV